MITLRNSLLWTYIFATVLLDWLFTQPEHRIEKLGSITLFCFELSPFNWKQHRRSRQKFCDWQIKLLYSISRIVDHTRDIVRPGFFGWTRNDCTQLRQTWPQLPYRIRAYSTGHSSFCWQHQMLQSFYSPLSMPGNLWIYDHTCINFS